MSDDKYLDPFNYNDIKPQNYKHKQNISSDLEQIIKSLENITNDWKERESSLQFIGRIVKGNQGHSDFFINYFNNKLSAYIEIQLSDLRSTVMKEACRITSLCAKELGLAIEQGIIQLLTQNCLFKIAGSANQVISESASKCILNLLRYVKSIKIISNICEIKTMKANSVRILCAQSLVNIMCFYDIGLIGKAKNILEETIETLLVDANAEVRATTRTSFILYKNIFELDAKKIFDKLGKNVQKQILEDEKNFGESKMRVGANEIKKNYKKDTIKLNENLNEVDDYKELLANKSKTPEFNNVSKKKSSKDFSKRKKSDRSTISERGRKSVRKKDNNNYSLNKEKKEETVKYINVDDDDIVENESDIEEDKKGPEDSRDVNMVFNYNNSLNKNKNSHKLSFNKKTQSKINDNFNNTKTNVNEAKQKNKKKENEKNKLAQSQNINPFLIVNENEIDNNKIGNVLNINNQDKNNENNNSNNKKISKATSNLTPEIINNSEPTRQSVKNNRVEEKANQKNMENTENIKSSNLDKKSKILKKFNSKFEKLNAFKNLTESMKLVDKTNNLKESKTQDKFDKSGEKVKVISFEINKKKNIHANPLKKSTDNFSIKNSKTIDYNAIKINSVNINDSENDKDILTKKSENKKNEKIETVNIVLDGEENDIEEDKNEVINIELKNEKIKKYNAKTMDKPKNKGNKNKHNINKKVTRKNKEKIYNRTKEKPENTNYNSGNKLENNNLEDLYNELSNTKSTDNTQKEEQIINGETLEQKVILILNKLDNMINQNEKLILFQYLFNYFNTILTEIKTFSSSTIKRYRDIHIENLKENDANLVEQILKNLMRMIFYLNDIFTIYDIELILKILLFSLNDSNIKTLKNLSHDLLDIIKKKCDNEELFQSVYSLLSEFNTNYDDCYDFMYLLIPSCDNILKNINYFKQVFRLICLTDVSSKKVGKIIDILYRNYRNNFNQAFNEESPNNRQQILIFMEKLNSLYFREFKSNFENNLIQNKSINNEIDSSKIGHNQINSNILKGNEKNVSILKQTESGNISFSKETSHNKNSETNINSISSNNHKEENNKSNNIIFNQNTKNNNNDINTINTNLNGNNIISINNSHNNNIIITNKLPDDIIPAEINSAIKNNDLEQYILYIQKHKSYIPEFILLLSNKKYSDKKYVLTLLNFTMSILNNSEFSIDLNTCINLLIKQMIYIYNSNKNNQKIKEAVNNILSEMPIYLNSEKCLSSMDKYLTSDTDVSSLEIIILSLENFAKNYKQKVEGINKEIKPLKDLLDNFIFEIFNLLKHQNSEIRKRALYCCLEIYTVLGKEFEPLVEKLPNAQQNLIRLYMKKRIK